MDDILKQMFGGAGGFGSRKGSQRGFRGFDGGNGGFYQYGNGAGNKYINHSGSSAGGYFEKYITGHTPGSSIWVTIGHGGASGINGTTGAPGMCIVEW